MLFTVNGYPNHAFLTTNGHIVFNTWVKSGERQICLQPLVDDFVMGLCYTSDDLNSGIIFVTNKSVLSLYTCLLNYNTLVQTYPQAYIRQIQNCTDFSQISKSLRKGIGGVCTGIE